VLTSSVVVGRGVGSDLQLDDDSVSRSHARFVVAADRDGSSYVTVEDLDSRNGTWVNGSTISTLTPLTAGDRITVGACQLELMRAPAVGANKVTQPVMPAVRTRSLAVLSPRERAVFPLLASGMSQREIANQCGVTVKTVETYRTRIGHKLGLSSRAELVQFALETGVLRPSATT
jgi:DNA-binding CsgD family transcriptional regulator